MQEVIKFIIENPVLIGVILTVIEAILMPIIPVKYNGLLSIIFTFIRKKYVKAKVEAEVKVEENEAKKKWKRL